MIRDTTRPTHRRGAIIARANLPMKERPKRRPVQKEIRRAAGHILREAHPTLRVAASTPCEIRVAEPRVRSPGRRSELQGAGPLPIRGFGLLEGGEDVVGGVEVVVVEGVVFEGGAGEPGGLIGLDEEAAARGDVLMPAAFEGVVRGPAPHVFDVGGGSWGQMDHSEGGHAGSGIRAAAGDVDVGVGRATDCDVGVPDADVAGLGACHVDLQDDGARRDISDCEAHVLDLGDADVTGVADLDDGFGVVGVAESGTDTGYDGPGFPDDAGSSRDEESGFDNVNAVREVRDFAISGVCSQDGVERSRVIGRAIAFDTSASCQ